MAVPRMESILENVEVTEPEDAQTTRPSGAFAERSYLARPLTTGVLKDTILNTQSPDLPILAGGAVFRMPGLR